MSKFIINSDKGQALISLLVVMLSGIIITSGAVAVTIINSQTTDKYASSEQSYAIAESGADNALLRLLRDPNYLGETVSIGNGTATVTVTGSTTKTIISEGVTGSFKRKIQVVGSFLNNVFTISSWSEIN